MLIAEHFVLIALEADSGLLRWPRRAQSADQLIAAALLLELATLQRLTLHAGLLSADSALPLSHTLLSDALHTFATRPLSVAEVLALIEHRLEPLASRILDGLFHRDILHRSAGGSLWRRHAHYPLRSVQARNEAIAHLHRAAVAAGTTPGLALLMLADVSGLLPTHLKAHEHEAATQQLLALNQADPEGDATRRIFAAVRTALLG